MHTGSVSLLWPRRAGQDNGIAWGMMEGITVGLGTRDLSLGVGFADAAETPFFARNFDRADGLLVSGYMPRPLLNRLRGKPVVWLGSHGPTNWGDRVHCANMQIGRDGAGYLHRRGCGRLIYVNLDLPHPAFHQQMLAFCDEADRLGLPLTVIEPAAVAGEHPQQSSGRHAADAARQLAAMDLDGAGVFVARDRHLVPLDRECRRLDFDLTPRLPVIACDNQDTCLTGLTQRPATFDLQPKRIDALAEERLAERRRHPERAGQTTVLVPALLVEPADVRPGPDHPTPLHPA